MGEVGFLSVCDSFFGDDFVVIRFEAGLVLWEACVGCLDV